MAINVKDKLVTLESLGIAYSAEQDSIQETKQELSARIDNIITPQGDPSLTEVSDARVSGLTTYNTLKARLDADKASVSTEIAEIKADLGDVEGKSEIAGANLFSVTKKTLTAGGYVPTGASGSTINPETVTTDSNMGYVVFDVSVGDAVSIKGQSKTGSNRRYYNIVDANDKCIKSGAAGGGAHEDVITIPDGGAYIVINLRSDLDYTIYHQANNANNRLLALESDSAKIMTGFNAYTDTPRFFRFSEPMQLGEFGGFANVTYAMRLVSSISFDHDIMLHVPDGFGIVVRYQATATRTAYDNWVWIPKNTLFCPAILYAGEAQSQTMTEEVARANLLYTKPISFDTYKDTFSSPGIFGEFAVIGDSYSLGSMHWSGNGYKGYSQYSWCKLMAKRHGINCTMYSHGGYGIKRFIENILATVLSDDPKDLYWWGLGINDADDARDSTKLGSIADLEGGDYTQYPDTLYGNYARVFEQIRAHAPLAKHVFVSCIKETPNHRYTSYKAINIMLSDIATYYGVPFIDLVDDPFYISKFYVDEVMTGHPTLIGYAGMSYANERLLNRCIADNVSYFRDYGRTTNPDDVDPTDSL